ncbi:MAG: phospholipase D-like domain-containing protein [Aquabacterium sp.]
MPDWPAGNVCRPSLAIRWLRHARCGLAIAGLIALQACAVLPERGPATESRAVVDHQTALARIAQASWPAGDAADSGFRLLPIADHAFAAREDIARLAQRTLDAQYYHIHHDSAGATFLRSLRDAARRGVRVRLLVDDLHNAAIMPWLKSLAVEPGVEVRFFNPVPARRGDALLRLLGSADDFDRANRRMHNKLFIADNVLAVFGGRNIGDEYFARGGDANFIDLDMLAAGRVVQDLSRVFDRYWNSEHAWPLADLERLPGQPALIQSSFEQDSARLALKVAVVPRDPLGQTPVGEQLAAGRLALHWADAAVYADPPSKVMAAAVLDEPTAAMRGQMELIESATSEVVLVNPYFVPSEQGLQLMAAARDKGIRGIFVTNSLGSTDEPLAYFYYSRKRSRMLKLGMELYELSPTLPQRTQTLGSFGRSLARLHAKGGIIDNRWLLVGSVNLDARSALLNTEMLVALDSPVLAQQARRLITGEQFLNMYRLSLDSDGLTTRWNWTDVDGTARTSTESPHFDGWIWLKLLLQSVFVNENLL